MQISDQVSDPSSFFQPGIRKKLAALGIDVAYHKASGDALFYLDENGHEVEVLDMLGGYGALFFGHNNPLLTTVAVEHFTALKPFLAQGSIRTQAKALSHLLHDMLYNALGRRYAFSFCNK